jgi:hypothetical protein
MVVKRKEIDRELAQRALADASTARALLGAMPIGWMPLETYKLVMKAHEDIQALIAELRKVA